VIKNGPTLPASSATSGGAPADARHFVAVYRNQMVRELPTLLGDMFPRLYNALADLADQAESRARSAACFDSARLLRRRRIELEALFLHRVRAAEHAFLNGSSGSPGEPGAEPEESLAVANLISKAETRYHSDLAALRAHMAHLLGQTRIDARDDPLGPHGICTAFSSVLKSVEELDLSTKLVVWKLFDKHVMDRIGAVYAGLVLQAKLSRPAATAGRTPAETNGQGGALTQGPDVASSSSGMANISARGALAPADQAGDAGFATLQRLLCRRRPPGDARPAVPVTTGELLAALSRLQTPLSAFDSGVSSGNELRRRLVAELDLGPTSGAPRVLAPPDEDTLDLVALVFEYILHGNDLPHPVKLLIGRLQIPFVKLALLDKSFFDRRDHAARWLLNHLAALALGRIDWEERSGAGVYRRMEAVVSRVVSDSNQEADLFDELDRQMVAILESERRAAQMTESEARREFEGRERHQDGRRAVLGVIEERLRWYDDLPETVKALIYDGWQEVLVAAYERGGMAGEDWRRAIRTLDRLVWSVQPKVDYGERRELLRSIPDLLRSLRESLAAVSFDPRRLARWIRELQTLHMAVLRGAGSAATEDAQAGPTAPGSITAGGQAGDGHTDDGPASLPLSGRRGPGDASDVPGLAIGGWIEIRRDDGQRLRVKLASHSPVSDRFLFVDRHGRNALELAASDLSALSAQGALTTLAWDTPIVDRALEAVLRTLQSR
jgi:hypothetical protein